MKEYFVLSDTHGFYKEMRNALHREGFLAKNPNHIVIVCGDMLDRGPEAIKCIKFFYKLHKEGRLIFVRGNHEDLFLDMVRRGFPYDHDYSNGTVDSYAQLYFAKYKTDYDPFDIPMNIKDVDPRWIELIDSSVNYYETKNYLFVHGWFPPYADREKWDSPEFRRAWMDARWDNGMEMAEWGDIIDGKTTVCGHWHTSYGNVRKIYKDKLDMTYRHLEFDDSKMSRRKLMGIFRDKGIIALDACTAWSGFCNCLKLTEKEI